MDTADAGNTALIGDEAHIVAKSLGGPRGGDTMPVDDRDEYGNLILLCANHHREVDINLDKYTIDELLRIKAGHEEWVRESLAVYDQERQTDDEQASAYVDEWLDQADILNWSSWASSLLVPQPRMTAERDKKLFGLRKWLQSRIWPDRYPELKDAFLNFRIVLDDMQEEFRRHAERIDYRDGVVLVTRKFYQITEWDPDRYHRLFREYEFHVDLVGDLVLELTRAAN
ncbi:MAG: hypothetical protein ACC700_19225, partial [Anaerolineales bacterium]